MTSENVFRQLGFECTDNYMPKKINVTNERNPWFTGESTQLGRRIHQLQGKNSIDGSYSTITCLHEEKSQGQCDERNRELPDGITEIISSRVAKYSQYPH